MTQAATKTPTEAKPTLEGLGAEIDELRGIVERQGAELARIKNAISAAGYEAHLTDPDPPAPAGD
jgi:hypothetical protein